MNDYSHIVEMEDIRTNYEKQLKEMEHVLDYIEKHLGDYRKLIHYYYSEQREKDLEDDENKLIPEELKRGVLSEDEIYDLMGDYHDMAVRMMEVALSMIKNDTPDLENKEM